MLLPSSRATSESRSPSARLAFASVRLKYAKITPFLQATILVSPRVSDQDQMPLKDVRAHCYCASLVRTLFIGHARATSFSSARTKSKTRQNDLCVNLVCEYFCWLLGDPHIFFRQITSFSDSFQYTKKKKIFTWEGLIISHILFT